MKPGYVSASFGHYVENTGNMTLSFLEVFNSGVYIYVHLITVCDMLHRQMEDIILGQVRILTPSNEQAVDTNLTMARPHPTRVSKSLSPTQRREFCQAEHHQSHRCPSQ